MTNALEPIPANVDPSMRVSAGRFVASLKGTREHVFGDLLTRRHGHFAYSVAQWRQVLADMKNEPVAPRGKARVIKIRTKRV